jgi:hypothetical protein
MIIRKTFVHEATVTPVWTLRDRDPVTRSKRVTSITSQSVVDGLVIAGVIHSDAAVDCLTIIESIAPSNLRLRDPPRITISSRAASTALTVKTLSLPA